MPSRLIHQLFRQMEDLRRHPRTPAVMRVYHYVEALAASLVVYADRNPLYAALLKRTVERLPDVSTGSPSDIRASEILMDTDARFMMLRPQNTAIAMERTEWLAMLIKEDRLPGIRTASRIVSAWTELQKERPMAPLGDKSTMLVVGIVVVAVPGVTMGRISRRITMPVIIRSDFLAAFPSLTITRAVSRAILNVVTRALTSSDGNMEHIEPDLSAWLLGDQETSFYAASGRSMATLAEELRVLDAPHATVHQAEERKISGRPSGWQRINSPQELTVLAASPSVNRAYLEARGMLTPINM